MVAFNPSTQKDDFARIQSWIHAEAAHVGVYHPHWFLTGGDCFLAGSISDDQGVVFYCRISNATEHDGDNRRVFMQYAPVEEVSKHRVIKTFLTAFPLVCKACQNIGAKGLVFESKSPDLIAFCQRLGFQHQAGDDYVYRF